MESVDDEESNALMRKENPFCEYADMFLNTNNIHVENTVFYGYCQ